jgi:hypothetical protein
MATRNKLVSCLRGHGCIVRVQHKLVSPYLSLSLARSAQKVEHQELREGGIVRTRAEPRRSFTWRFKGYARAKCSPCTSFGRRSTSQSTHAPNLFWGGWWCFLLIVVFERFGVAGISHFISAWEHKVQHRKKGRRRLEFSGGELCVSALRSEDERQALTWRNWMLCTD